MLNESAGLVRRQRSEQQCKVVDDCLQLFGAYGDMTESRPPARTTIRAHSASWRLQRRLEGPHLPPVVITGRKPSFAVGRADAVRSTFSLPAGFAKP